MKISVKKAILCLSISGLLLIMAGCGGKPSGDTFDKTEIQQAVEARIKSFRTAVEDYNVESMLNFLDQDAFQLTIAEGGISLSYSKGYTKLNNELEEDRGKQLHWREPARVGHGYILTMELGAITYSKINASGACAVIPFTIKEEAEDPKISQRTTDKGHMTCDMVKLQGSWRCREMTINFEPPTSTKSVSSSQIVTPSALYKVAYKTGSSEGRRRGICFGCFNFGEIP